MNELVRCEHGRTGACYMCQQLIDQREADTKHCVQHGTDVTDDVCRYCVSEERKKPSALDVQVGGEHYKDQRIQPVQYIEANQLGFLEGCVVKRVTRHNAKTGKGREDIEKAIHELQLLLELRYGAQ